MLSSCTARQSHGGVTLYYADVTPDWVRLAWQATSGNLTRDVRRPELHVLKSAGGRVGFFRDRRDAPHVAVGLADLRHLARQIFARLPRVSAVEAYIARLHGRRVLTYAEVLQQVAELLFGHELGHAIEAAGGRSDGTVAEEVRADRWAGEFAESAGVDPLVGMLFFEVVGCTAGPQLCSHPDPQARVNAYLRGRAKAIARAEAAGAW